MDEKSVGLKTVDRALAKALGRHFSRDNCCGVLTYVFKVYIGCGCYDYSFTCKKCGKCVVAPCL